jgi:hypothetical protein
VRHICGACARAAKTGAALSATDELVRVKTAATATTTTTTWKLSRL